MKTHKPTHSRPLPDGSKIFTCKRGQHKGKRFAKYQDGKARMQEKRLTKAGDRILVESKVWHITFEDNLGIRRDVKAYADKAATAGWRTISRGF